MISNKIAVKIEYVKKLKDRLKKNLDIQRTLRKKDIIQKLVQCKSVLKPFWYYLCDISLY